jgi:hypothetical protein
LAYQSKKIGRQFFGPTFRWIGRRRGHTGLLESNAPNNGTTFVVDKGTSPIEN